jgi:LPS-assembly protein
MKNSFFIILFVFFSDLLSAKDLDISAKNISLDKKNQTSIFKENVVIKDENNTIIKSDYAIYNDNLKTFEIEGNVFIQTNEGYSISSEKVLLDKKLKIITSNSPSIVTDTQSNKIFLGNFKYSTNENIFKSIGNIKIIDKFNNIYKFSQIYIDEKKKELIGSDSKVFFNQEDLKEDKLNKPRIFSNTINIKQNQTSFTKSTFTSCDYRKNDKCPPWELSANKITHNNLDKTVYYDDVVIRVYNIPIFYFPKLAHPDPSVKRRSGFLIPSYSQTKNLGSSVNIPYFFAIDKDRDFTIKNRLFVNEHPLFLGEYRQAFKNSNLILDLGFTEGYKNTTTTKTPGDKSHFFSKFEKKFNWDNNSESNFKLNIQNISNKKYLKLYKVNTDLITNYETSTLENYIDFEHFDDEKNLYLDLRASIFRNLGDEYNDKYEYILPELNVEKNLFSENLGYGNVNTNLKLHNYDTNKYEKFLINDFKWSIDKNFLDLPYNGKFLSSLKNVNYEAKNVKNLKKNSVHEVFGAIGYLSSVDLIKQNNEQTEHFLKPKLLLKYAPNHMRKSTDDHNLYSKNIFNLDRLESSSNFEGGTSLAYGFDYEIDIKNNSKTNFSIGQIINEKKNNKKMPASSTLDNRFSDVIGNLNYKSNKNLEINYNYSIDQNFKEMTYNEVDGDFNFGNVNFNLNYYDKSNVSETKEYLKSSIEIKKGNNGLFTFKNNRNIVTNSSEYYNLSYEYLNDCLRAGLVYRREFYNDSELEPENSLMFKITLSPFGSLISPKFSE